MKLFKVSHFIKSNKVLIVIYLTIVVASVFYLKGIANKYEQKVGILDYIAYYNSGIRYYIIGDRDFIFDIPTYWLGMNFILNFLIYKDTRRKLDDIGEQYFTRIENRLDFWASQYKFVIRIVVFMSMLSIVAIFILSILIGNINGSINDTLQNNLFGINSIYFGETGTITALVIGILFINFIHISICEVMLYLTVSINGVYPFLIVVAIYSISLFVSFPLFLPNYLMLSRITNPKLGINLITGIIVGACFLSTTYFKGKRYIKNKDII